MSGPFVSSVSRRHPRLRRFLIATGVVVVLLAIPALALGGLWAVDRDAVPPRTTIAGVELSGSTREQAAPRSAGTSTGRSVSSARAGSRSPPAPRSGRSRSPTRRWTRRSPSGFSERAARHLGLGGERSIQLEYRLGPVRTCRAREPARRSLRRSPHECGSRAPRHPACPSSAAAPGTAVDRRALTRALRTLPHEVGLSVIDAAPAVPGCRG